MQHAGIPMSTLCSQQRPPDQHKAAQAHDLTRPMTNTCRPGSEDAHCSKQQLAALALRNTLQSCWYCPPQAPPCCADPLLRCTLHMSQVGHFTAADLLQHGLGRALTHVCVSRDHWLAGVVDLAGVHMAQVVLSSHLVQEAVLVPLQEGRGTRHTHTKLLLWPPIGLK